MHQAHQHPHAHGHSHAVSSHVSGQAMGMAVTATLVFVAIEAVAGWLGRSLALMSDATHNLGDAASALGVAAAGALVAITHTQLADPAVSLVIAALIVFSSLGVLKESATVLLEGTPSGINATRLGSAIKEVSGVLDVHDLHVWMLGPGVV